MAKVVITLWDKRGGGVGCTVDLDPPLKRGKKQTQAQNMLTTCLEALSNASSKAEIVSIDDEDV